MVRRKKAGRLFASVQTGRIGGIAAAALAEEPFGSHRMPSEGLAVVVAAAWVVVV